MASKALQKKEKEGAEYFIGRYSDEKDGLMKLP
jgi:hypothetical protein